jgi:hypothetical protein
VAQLEAAEARSGYRFDLLGASDAGVPQKADPRDEAPARAAAAGEARRAGGDDAPQDEPEEDG